MFRKIITYFLILAVVLPVLAGAAPLPFRQAGGGQILGVNVAQAEDTTEKTGDKGEVIDPCGSMAGLFKGSFWDCAAFTFVNLFYDFVFLTSVWIAGWASDLFNVSIQFSLTGESFDANKNIMIKEGWTLVRDLLNLVFIFILLYAAISTILQYGGVDIKKILPMLIVAALLVNFSMMIAKMVIDASHIFAWEFYNQIDVTDGGNVPNLKSSANVDKDFVKKDLASVFLAGFNPHRLLIGGKTETGATVKGDAGEEAEKSPWKQVLEKATKSGESFMDTLWRVLIIIFFESALAILSAFILLAGAIMFIIRVVVLWLVIIFSPVAFLSMILPSMEKYSKMWWSYLIDQSFFAPAFLFMFMLATKFINSKLIDSLLKITENDSSKIVTGLNMGEIVLISFNFLIAGGIMMACLIVARQLGGKTAEFGIGWAHKGKALALGAAGKVAGYGWRNAKASARYAGGQMADKMLDEEKGWGKSRFAKTLSWMGADPGLRKLGAMKKADEDKKRKEAEKYASGLSGAGRKNLEREIAGYKTEYGYKEKGMHTAIFEGYEKIIAKKTEEDKEEKLYYESWAELYNKTKLNPAEKDVIAENSKERIKRGELGNMEEEIEKRRKEFNEKKEQEKENNNLKISKKNREIRRLEVELAEQRKKGEVAAAGLTEKVIDGLDREISTLNKLNNEITVIDKVLDRHEKKVESYRSRELSKGKPAEEKKEKETKSK